MTSNVDSEIIKNLRASGNQNTLAQSSFSSMVLNGTEIKGATNTVSKSTKYSRSKPQQKVSSAYSNAVILSVLDNGDMYVSGNQEAELVYSTGRASNTFKATINNYGDSWLISCVLFPTIPDLDNPPVNNTMDFFTLDSNGVLTNYSFTLPLLVRSDAYVSPTGEAGIFFTFWSAAEDHIPLTNGYTKARTFYFDSINTLTPDYQVTDTGGIINIETVNYGIIELDTSLSIFELSFKGQQTYYTILYDGINYQYIINDDGIAYLLTLGGLFELGINDVLQSVSYRWFVEFDVDYLKEGFLYAYVLTIGDFTEWDGIDYEQFFIQTDVPYFGLTDDTKIRVVDISVFK